MAGSMYKMVLPEKMDSVESLDHWKRRFDSMSRSQRNALDDASVKSYGWTNTYRYIRMRNSLEKEGKLKAVPKELTDIDEAFSSIVSDNTTEGEVVGSDYDKWQLKLFRARQAEADGLTIMVDTTSPLQISDYTEENINRLKEKWEKFLADYEERRVRSSMTAQDIFGYDNYNLYTNIMSAYTDHIKEEPINRTTITSADKVSPYFTPEEMQENPISYSNECFIENIGKESIDQFMESYMVCRELKDQYKWCKALEELYIERDLAKNKDKIPSINQSILKLGWNPEIPFTRHMSSKCAQRVAIRYNITDVTEAYNDENELTAIQEAASKAGLKAVFVVLLKSGTKLAQMITKATGSKWGHSGIAFDSSLNTIYTFAMERDPETGKANPKKNGFVTESLKTYMDLKSDDHEKEIRVYAMFVTTKELKSMKKGIQWFKEHQNETRYDVLGLLRIFFGKVDRSMDNTHMVCSQFVYTILCLAKMSLADMKDPSLATPGDIDALKKKLDFTYIYDGHPKRYKSTRTDKIVDALCATQEQLNSEE